MSDPDPIKKAWKASAANPALPTLDMVRAGAETFHRQIRRRNAVEYATCAVVVVCFAAYVLILPSPAARIGAAMVVIGTLIAGWQLHLRASATRPPERGASEPILIHQRAQLERQRQALADIFTWYLLPFMPGLLVMIFASVIDRGTAGLLHAPRSVWVSFALMVAAATGVWLINRRAAVQLQKQIDDIDTLTGRNGR